MYLSAASESGRCEACGQFFIREASLTKHRNNCSAAQERSRQLWKNGPSNIKKLNASWTDSRKRHREEVQPYRDYELEHEELELDVPHHIAASATMETLPSKRIRRPTWKVLEDASNEVPEDASNEIPCNLSSVAGNNDQSSPIEGDNSEVSPIEMVSNVVITPSNQFGIVQEYQQPTASPISVDWWMLLCTKTSPTTPTTKREVTDIIYPYPNITSFIFNLTWRRMRGVISSSGRTSIVDAILNEQFKSADLVGVDFTAIEKQVAMDVQSPWGGNGWRRNTIIIEVPTGQKPTAASRRMAANARARSQRYDEVDPNADPFVVYKLPIHDVRTRSLTQTMLEAIQDGRNSAELHWFGRKETWQPPYHNAPRERVWGELYTSDAFLNAERDLITAHQDPLYPCVLAAFMIWSDSTHLAQFGQAKAWPIYAYFGNQSKYTRCKPSSRSCQVIGYVPALPDSFAESVKAHDVSPTPALLAHCRRELFHGVWRVLLDQEFCTIYEHGVVVTCADGIVRRVFPRIFTYSADYPEKVLIATIRDMGRCPCPRCTIKKEDFGALGTTTDAESRRINARHDDDDFRAIVQEARDNIYRRGYALGSQPGVERLLREHSLVPTLNAFSHSLSKYNFNIFLTLVVDIMHEFELGVWKALLTHLVRILHSHGADTVHEFNQRFREISPFGSSTIRKFRHNVADMKKLAARDFEDILQCCIPCFEGLLPEPHDNTILKLLYLASYWHSLAKLRLHTETTLKVLDNVTVLFARALRHFKEVTCPCFSTVETDREYNARCRAAERRTSRSQPANNVQVTGKRAKTFNLLTSKLHALGDYIETIKMFGTTDSYSTQIGELEHRNTKIRYGQTNKQCYIDQMVDREAVERVHERMNDELVAWATVPADLANSEDGHSSGTPCGVDIVNPHTENFPMPASGHWCHIGQDQSQKVYLPGFLNNPQNATDPAFKDFYPNLLSHLLARHLHQVTVSDEPAYSGVELANVIIQHNTIFSHATATLNYTTYDVIQDHDTINCNSSRCDIMLRACDDRHHPFWYARVLGIYHANIFFGPDFSSKPERMEFFFVRWFGRDPDWQGGPNTCKLDRIGWVPENDSSGAFGFLNPACAIRACHLIPAFAYGKTVDLLPPSQARDFATADWVNYYVSRFVDRDMMMRYLGWGIGHRNPPDFTHEANALIASRLDRELENSTTSQVDSNATEDDSEIEAIEGGSDGSGSDPGESDMESEVAFDY